MSKSLALLKQGFSLLGQGFTALAEELEEGAGAAALLGQGNSQTKPEEKKADPKKETVKETKTETAPEVDYAKVREECRSMVGDLCLALKKPDVVALLKKHGVAGVSEAHCPDATKLPAIHADLKPLMTEEVEKLAKKVKDDKAKAMAAK